jgi:hypothetical protein
MAGGTEWALIRLEDASRIFQKVEDGPWFLQKHYVLEITRKVHVATIDTTPNKVGTYSGLMVFSIGGVTKIRTMSGTSVYVCRSDKTLRIDEASNYAQQTQIWEWLEPEDDAVEILTEQAAP